MSEQNWFSPQDKLPPDDLVVNTMNSSGHVIQMKRRGRLWFVPDDSFYVYYEPTFWKPIEESKG